MADGLKTFNKENIGAGIETAFRKSPDLIKLFQQIESDPILRSQMNPAEQRDYSLLKFLAPGIFKERDYSLGNQGLAIGSKEAIDTFKNTPEYQAETAESSRANAEARAEMFGVGVEPIREEVNERSTL